MYIYYEAHRITSLCPVPNILGRPHNDDMTMSSFPSAGTWHATLGTATWRAAHVECGRLKAYYKVPPMSPLIPNAATST